MTTFDSGPITLGFTVTVNVKVAIAFQPDDVLTDELRDEAACQAALLAGSDDSGRLYLVRDGDQLIWLDSINTDPTDGNALTYCEWDAIDLEVEAARFGPLYADNDEEAYSICPVDGQTTVLESGDMPSMTGAGYDGWERLACGHTVTWDPFTGKPVLKKEE